MKNIIVGHVKFPPKGYESIRCDRASVLGNPYTFMHEDFRDRSIESCRQWLWQNIKFANEHRHDPMFEELMEMTAIAPEKVEALIISSVFKRPSVLQVIRELELIAKVANTKGDVALLCWCCGYPNPENDKACHCGMVKRCVENLFL